MNNWTIQKLLNWMTEYFTEKGLESPRLCGELLLSSVLGLKRIELYTEFDTVIGKEQLEELHKLVKRAGDGEPIQYLTGKVEFYSIELEVCEDCLIPRPETELLVERAIDFLRSREGRQSVCDLCTGCGCIAVAIAKNFPDGDIAAMDISAAALSVASKNVTKYGLDNRIKLLCGDLFGPVVPEIDTGQFDLIVCNPPYVSGLELEKLEKNVKDYEPEPALYGGEDGVEVYRRIAEKAPDFLKAGGALILEIGYRQGDDVTELLEKTDCFKEIKLEKDHHDNDRVITTIRT
ncbi:MAG: peptide chain release factor N(5)-glutamine methyltransferase [Planctomycetota bacterium]|jgi:release factor glutamine methyltransferase